jgi:hypothetical protein
MWFISCLEKNLIMEMFNLPRKPGQEEDIDLTDIPEVMDFCAS